MTPTPVLEPCVGCGAQVPRIAGPVHRYMTAAPGCWAAYGELTARLLAQPAARAVRQLCVDAYAVQHPGSPNPQAIQSVAAHLISLCAQLEHGYPTERAAGLLQRATERKAQYEWLTPPSFEGSRTVLAVGRTDDLPAAARAWATDAWHAWAAYRSRVEQWYARLVQAPAGS